MARPGSDGLEPRELRGLSPAERRALATLAVAGPAAVAPARLAALADLDDVSEALASLERRGLVVGDDAGSFAIPPVQLERLRYRVDLTEPGEALLLRLVTLAHARRLSAGDMAVVLGVAGWAADAGWWTGVARLVGAVRSAGGVTARPDEWLDLLGLGLEAARALRDRDAEAWLLEQSASAAAAAGDAAVAERLLRRATRLRRDVRLAAEGAHVRRALWRVVDPARGWPRVAAGVAVLAALAAGGFAVGLVALEEDAATGAVATFTIVQTTVGERTATVTTTVERRRTLTARPSRRLVLRTVTEPASPTDAALPVATVVSTRTVHVPTTVLLPTTVRVPATVVVTTTVVVPTTAEPPPTTPPP